MDRRFNEHGFLQIYRHIEQAVLVISFLTMKTLIQNLGLTNTTFNKFLIISNKNIGFLFRFCHKYSKQNHIFELWSLILTLEPLRSVNFSDACVVWNSNSKELHSILEDDDDPFKLLNPGWAEITRSNISA